MKYLSIGKMSKLSNISIRTLRYYDQINLFKPEYINKENNYRYYSIQQLFYLEIIKYLRKLKMPINDIKNAMSLSPKQLNYFLEKQEKEINSQINELNHIKNLLENQRIELSFQNELLDKTEGKIYRRMIKKRTIVKQICNGKITPLTQPDLYFSELYHLLETNSWVPKSYQYNCSFTLRNYDSLDEINYNYLFINVYPTEDPSLHGMTDEIAEGEYLCVKFNWNVQNYLKNYLVLKEAYENLGCKGNPIVYEVSMANHFDSSHDGEFVSELQIKI
ncbi:MerR family transcriptional regulator [Enterococcus sp. DIV1298c]|uniref:MerR family transcriptional regulator n=1 Tax=Enterococcus sp. DIV1298c TaxID=2815328 RepID=UPI001A91BF7D|nr:helix-turn-helix domain-containing protein [Enterococcus sp. DIV1298c]MBO0462434.1 MerR family transcriptional regulator [Enterococcus sp. DIV1298c]